MQTVWVKEFSVAHASVREAINLLIAEGFLVKDARASARVVTYREQDVTHVYEVRGRPKAWIGDLPNHRPMLQVIRAGNPILAGRFMQHCIRRFAASAYAVWENVGGSVEAHHKGQRSRGRMRKHVDA